MGLISVIIPCYNHGEFLPAALESIALDRNEGRFEAIVVDDGSNDKGTIAVLERIEQQGIKVIRQANKGLGHARNAGIAVAKGDYILPLDSDNQILPDVMLEIGELLDRDIHLDVGYSDGMYFGEKSGAWHVGQFSAEALVVDNYIDACAVIRKSTLTRLGGYDGEMPFMGHEDWDLWIRIWLSNGRFAYLNKVGFRYRVRFNSMIRSMEVDQISANAEYIYRKNRTLLGEQLVDLMPSLRRQIREGQNSSRKLNFIRRYTKNYRLQVLFKVLFGKALV